MFTRFQHALKRVFGRHVHLTADVHDDLEAWRKLVRSLSRSPTHLRKLQPFSPTWIGTTNTPGSGMGGVCQDPEGQYFVWRSLYSLATQERLVSSFNPDGNVKINNLEMGALIMKLLLFSLRMVLLAHIHTYVDNAETQVWANRGSVRTAFFVSPILRDLSFAARR